LAASQDGINANTGRRCYDEVWEMYYGHGKPRSEQAERRDDAIAAWNRRAR